MNGIELIAAERTRQVEVEGWTPEHDAEHVAGELPLAAAGYAQYAGVQSMVGASPGLKRLPAFWPWGREWWKPSDDPIRNLEKAGALIAAEIDRLQAQDGGGSYESRNSN